MEVQTYYHHGNEHIIQNYARLLLYYYCCVSLLLRLKFQPETFKAKLEQKKSVHVCICSSLHQLLL